MKPIVTTAVLEALCAGAWAQEAEDENFEGGLAESVTEPALPKPVRNDVFQPGEPIVTKRCFKIEKGTFPKFLEASRDGVWKIGDCTKGSDEGA